MFITRVSLRRYPAPNIIHGIIAAAFPGRRSDIVNENLWRVDNLGERRILLIVSVNSPDLQKITSEMGAKNIAANQNGENDKPDKTIDYQPFLTQLRNDQVWNFRLCANPVEHKKEGPAGKRGKILALHSVPEQLEWLDRQGTKYGFSITSSSVIGDSWIVFGNVRIRSITFDGILHVTDADAFRIALSRGIGRGKAYGCGLLTVAKVQI